MFKQDGFVFLFLLRDLAQNLEGFEDKKRKDENGIKKQTKSCKISLYSGTSAIFCALCTKLHAFCEIWGF